MEIDVSSDKQVLVFDSKELENDLTIDSYNINNEDTVHLNISDSFSVVELFGEMYKWKNAVSTNYENTRLLLDSIPSMLEVLQSYQHANMNPDDIDKVLDVMKDCCHYCSELKSLMDSFPKKINFLNNEFARFYSLLSYKKSRSSFNHQPGFSLSILINL